MSAWGKWFAPLAALALVLGAFGWLFQVRLGGGDVYPEYSSLRADALGTRALYEALEQIDGIQVEREYRPLAKLGAHPRLVVLPGLDWQDWQFIPANQLEALNAAARGGARIVLTFRADRLRDDLDAHGRSVIDKKDEKDGKKAKDAKDAKKKKLKRPGIKEPELKELAKEWGVTIKQRWLMGRKKGAQRTDDAPAGLPSEVAWQSDVHFFVATDSGWRTLYRRGSEAVLIEKQIGRGSIVLLADAYCLSNEAMHKERATGLLSYLVGESRRVTFVESVLGVTEDNGVGFLARRYGLGGALALCALLGALYAWRRLVAFLPPLDARAAGGEVALDYEPAAGFTGLLRRSLGVTGVLPASIEEWRKARRGGGNTAAAARLEAAWQARDPKQSLAATYNALVRALKPH